MGLPARALRRSLILQILRPLTEEGKRMLLKELHSARLRSAVAGMVALTVYLAGLSAPAAANEADLPPHESSVTVDRDPHFNLAGHADKHLC